MCIRDREETLAELRAFVGEIRNRNTEIPIFLHGETRTSRHIPNDVLREMCIRDRGKPTVVGAPDSRAADIYRGIARRVAVKIAEKAKDMTSKFPNIVVQNT